MKLVMASLAVFSLTLLGIGCGKKTSTHKSAENKGGDVKSAHGAGPHGGPTSDVGAHKYLVEVVVKKGTLDLYFLDHDDKSKSVKTESTEITITKIKHDGKSLPDVKLAVDKADASHFSADGDAVKEIHEAHALHGATFQVKISGKDYDVTIEAHEGEHKD